MLRDDVDRISSWVAWASWVVSFAGSSRFDTLGCWSRMARRLHPRASNRQGAATTTNHRFAKTPQSFQSRCDTGESPGSVLPSCCLRNVPSAIPQLKSPICRHFLFPKTVNICFSFHIARSGTKKMAPMIPGCSRDSALGAELRGPVLASQNHPAISRLVRKG